jgi:SpoVK/Ycf46/Vps4 family AAA+-type ATPase
LSPCVVFIDELDALLGARIGREAGAFSHRGVITEFMSEMDGLKSSKEDRVIVIGATNRPFDLDDAVLRRLPRRLLVDLPGENEREGQSFLYWFKCTTEARLEILKIMLRNEQLAPDVDVKALAKKTESFSGSDLKSQRDHNLFDTSLFILSYRSMCFCSYGCCQGGRCVTLVAEA